jgi:hypothetical protein
MNSNSFSDELWELDSEDESVSELDFLLGTLLLCKTCLKESFFFFSCFGFFNSSFWFELSVAVLKLLMLLLADNGRAFFMFLFVVEFAFTILLGERDELRDLALFDLKDNS